MGAEEVAVGVEAAELGAVLGARGSLLLAVWGRMPPCQGESQETDYKLRGQHGHDCGKSGGGGRYKGHE